MSKINKLNGMSHGSSQQPRGPPQQPRGAFQQTRAPPRSTAALSTLSLTSDIDQPATSGSVTPEMVQSMITQQFQQLLGSSVGPLPTSAAAMSASDTGVFCSSPARYGEANKRENPYLYI